MPYTLAEAAAATGMNKSSVLRAIKSGKISGSKNEMGEWLVEPVELHRVYSPVARTDAGPAAPQRDAATDALVAELRASLADMRAQRDSWQQQAERLAIAASIRTETAPMRSAASVPSVTVVARRSWLPWRQSA